MNNVPHSPTQKGPTRAYVEEVVEGLKSGGNAECPICLEAADDHVLTPCAHRMCRECLITSWGNPSAGQCPICWQKLKQDDLITCPYGGKARIDSERNWKESSKISTLIECLEKIRGYGEKPIVFSQWTSFLDILEVALKKRNFGFLRYDGKLLQKDKERVLHEFNETKEKRVLLMSLQSWWCRLESNSSFQCLYDGSMVESSSRRASNHAGSSDWSETHCSFRRFIVKDTVEQRLQQIQARKQRMIAGALTDEEVRMSRLEELKMLFK